MRLRGKILRDPGADRGLVMLEGHQYWFSAAEWRSDAKPIPGMEVEAMVDDGYRITEIALAPEGLDGCQTHAPGRLARILHWLILRAKGNEVERKS